MIYPLPAVLHGHFCNVLTWCFPMLCSKKLGVVKLDSIQKSCHLSRLLWKFACMLSPSPMRASHIIIVVGKESILKKPRRLSARVLQHAPVMLCLASAGQLSSSSMPF